MAVQSSFIQVSLHPAKGRMVIATQLIQSGETIEIAPVLTVAAKTRELLKSTELFQHSFARPDLYTENQPTEGYFVLGCATLCNHSQHPNAKIEWVHNDIGNWAHLIAIETINPDEEIVLFYTDIEEYDAHLEFDD